MILTLDDIKQALALLASIEVTMHEALASSGTNSLNKLTIDIVKYIKENKSNPPTINKLRLIFWDIGDMQAINAAIEYLVITHQIKPAMNAKNENVYECVA